jgi:hypothetical protein
MVSKVSLLALLALGAANATTYTFANVFPNDGHVIGDPAKFAIKNVIVDVTTTQVKVIINTNYDNPTLSPFTVGNNYQIQMGDFFFMAAGSIPQFGVAIETHGGTVNGVNTGNNVLNTNLYQINAGGLLKSDDVMNKKPGDNLDFNSGQYVWMKDNGSGSITPEAGTSVIPVTTPLAKIGNGTTTPLYSIMFTINRASSSSDAFNKLIDSNAWAFQFESADCANDYFGGTTPEPATLSLMGLGLVAFSFKSKRVRSTFRNLHSRSN